MWRYLIRFASAPFTSFRLAKFGWVPFADLCVQRLATKQNAAFPKGLQNSGAIHDINLELLFQPDEGGRRGHDLKLFKKRFRLDVRINVFFLIQLLIIGICSLPVVSTVALLTLSRNTSCLNWNQKL